MRFCATLCVVLFLQTTSYGAIVFNEFNPNPAGDEMTTSFIEFAGNPGESLGGLFLIAVDTDTGGANLVINNVVTLSGSIAANGVLAQTIEIENPSYTLVLSNNPNALAAGNDLDPDDNGVIDDLSVFGTVADAVSIFDGTTDSPNGFAGALGGTDLTYPTAPDPTDGTGAFFDSLPSDEPEIAFRDRISRAWYQGSADFSLMADAAGNPVNGSSFDQIGFTQGAANPAIPEPSSFVVGLAMLVSLGFGRRRIS